MNDYADLLSGSTPNGLTNDQITQSIDHLTTAIEILEKIKESYAVKMFNFPFMALDCSNAWFAINKCRVHTENIVEIEEVLQPVMGLINDAKCMIESLQGWQLGMTKYAYLNIGMCLSISECQLRDVVDEMVSWMSPEGSINSQEQQLSFRYY